MLTGFPSAEEARHLSDVATEDTFQAALLTIKNEVDDAVKGGSYSASVRKKDLGGLRRIINFLETQGYEVEESEQYLTVCWN